MNFFEHQYRAKRKTWLLVVYFLLAVTLIILSVNLAVYAVFIFTAGDAASNASRITDWFNGPVAFWISVATLFVIVLGTLHAILKLRGGGRVIAEMVGAEKVNPNTRDIKERRLINVVEEMSIASGTPVPELYILEDLAINAFVAGYRPTETVMVVTQGALENFSRDELQGVIGHEYSHIFNGDMRINIRLMGILAGILLIGQIGGFILRSSGRRSSRSNKGGGQVMLLGLALFIIGYIGLFFGSLIKAAISRQREFLADASSVQFTRNPDGIAGALWAIKENIEGSKLINAHAEDVSHFCFSDAIGTKFLSMLATHPPLDDRIKAINPHFDIKMRLKKQQEPELSGGESRKAAVNTGVTGMGPGVMGAAVAGAVLNGMKVRDSVGRVQAEHLAYAEKTRAGIPEPLDEAVHDQETVRQVIYSLVLADMKQEQVQQGLEVIRKSENQDITAQVQQFLAHVVDADKSLRLPLINMAIPVLKNLNSEERSRFLDNLEKLVLSDNRYTVFEFALLTILREHLAGDSGRDVREKYFKYNDVIDEISLLLSVLVRVGTRGEGEAGQTYDVIIKHFTNKPMNMVEMKQCKLNRVSSALKKLNLLTPLLKQTVLESFADCVILDGRVLPAEAEILQAIAISLDCPMPPLAL